MNSRMRSRCRASRSVSDVAYGQPEEPGRVERLARRHRHARVVEQRLRELRGRADAVGRQELADVGEQIERAGRLDEPDARLRRQPLAQPDRGACGTRSSISVTQSCGPVSAATTAFCVIEQTFEVEWLCSALHGADHCLRARAPSRSASRSSRRPSTPSRRAPRDRACARASTLDEVVRHRVVDQLLVAEIDQDPDAARAPPRRRSGSSSASEISAPVGLPGELMMMPLRPRRDRREDARRP